MIKLAAKPSYVSPRKSHAVSNFHFSIRMGKYKDNPVENLLDQFQADGSLLTESIDKLINF